MSRFIVMGMSHAKGTAKTTGKEYLMPRLYFATSLRSWQTDKGVCSSAGYQCDENNRGVIDFIDTVEMKEKLLAVPFPVVAELILEPDPENPLNNIVVDIEVLWSIWDGNPANKK
ncbi:hypothetical protein [Photobacterium indicum]|uniref:hypothetical protein n=1 Tax=Photobacterium indicum TaxID=81447 RepID=UPI003D103DAC